MRMLIGAVGYRNLRDHSAAFEVLERLSAEDFGPDVVLEDVSYNPIAFVQWLEEPPPGSRFECALLVSSVQRPGRMPGSFTSYQWNRVVPSNELVQQAITEAVTGIISLDNTLVIAGYFGALPPAVTIVEIEPAAHEFGFELSAAVGHAVESVAALIRDAVHERHLDA